MKFSKVELIDKKYLNYVFIRAYLKDIPVIAMFDTRGNTLIKKSLADKIDISYIDEKPIDEKRGWRRARTNLRLGGLEIGSAPVIVADDKNFAIAKDPEGNSFPADMILGWNIISQLCFRGNLRIGDFEVQVDDFRKAKSKDRENTPVLYVEFDGKRRLAALDTSKSVTTISQDIFEKIIEKNGEKETLDMLDLPKENLTYQTSLTIKVDEDEITLPACQVDHKLKDSQVQIVLGADLLWHTTWAIYSPMRYIRAKQQ